MAILRGGPERGQDALEQSLNPYTRSLLESQHARTRAELVLLPPEPGSGPHQNERRFPANPHQNGTYQEMAIAVAEAIPLGTFWSMDCQEVIQQGWPEHTLARAADHVFGHLFRSSVWPYLQLWGARTPGLRGGKIRYEMTAEAKEKDRECRPRQAQPPPEESNKLEE